MRSVCYSGETHDIHGIAVMAGDLVRTFHFRAAQRRQKFYLHHVACERDGGYLQLVPAQYLNPTTKEDGGCCWLTWDFMEMNQGEVIGGTGFVDRKLAGRKRAQP